MIHRNGDCKSEDLEELVQQHVNGRFLGKTFIPGVVRQYIAYLEAQRKRKTERVRRALNQPPQYRRPRPKIHARR
ncbi:MAG TPA: hypothetical protein VM103_00055, partial [Candidatus Paceibacterota bacterium]|nr:hypothetical protein [Candidatus Paceibacterota bacterium]